MEQIVQIFNPPLRVCWEGANEVTEIRERIWNCDNKANFSEPQVQKMGYIGRGQIEEVWKHYNKEYYISNYGYVVKIKNEDKVKARKIIPAELKKADAQSAGMRWKDFSVELKNLFRDNAFVPYNRKHSGCQICLNVTGSTSQYDLHKLVAHLFLKKPQIYKNEDCIVHRLDNNSYNNSVTNLVWLKKETHSLEKHFLYHPMSR